ncbi:MAG: glycosyltransferase family 9 protein [Spirosomataceae bacterium]
MIAKYPFKIKAIYTIAEFVFWLIISLLSVFRVFQRKASLNHQTKILLLEPYQMGDVISLSLLLNPLKQKYPNSEIYILSKTPNYFQNDNRIKAVYRINFAWTTPNQNRWKSILEWKTMLHELSFLKKQNFDIGIETRGDIRSQFIMKYIGVKQTIGYKQAITTDLKNYGLLVNHAVIPKYKHRFEWNLYTLTELGIEESNLFPIQLPSFYTKQSVKPTQNYILIHIGGGWKYKLWSNQKWILLIEKLIEKYHLMVRVIGGANESDNLGIIKNHFNNSAFVTCEMTDFERLTERIQHAELLICLDSGPQNLASCMNKKTIVLFGPGHSEAFGPYSLGSKFIHKIHGFDCHPCFQQSCKRPSNSCMTQIEVQDVLDLIEV